MPLSAPDETGMYWRGRRSPHVPRCNRENNIAAREAASLFHLSPSEVDRLRVLYIKSYKVGSTTISNIIERLAVAYNLTIDSRLGNASAPQLELSDALFHHNYYGNNNSGIDAAHTNCALLYNVHGDTWCNGYQPWMDFYLPRAWRLVMVAEPLERLASMLYYEFSDYSVEVTTKNGHAIVHGSHTLKQSPPSDAQSTQGRLLIRNYFQKFEGRHSESRVQWHWLREGTPNRTLDNVIEMLRNNAFLVGLTSMFDETLMLWRYFLGLFVEDILYHRMKADSDHPKANEWHKDEIESAKTIIERNGDTRFYTVAEEVFEAQVMQYGGWDRLQNETEKFQHINTQLQRECAHVEVPSIDFGLYDRAVCMVAKYREYGFAKEFGEE